jgi:hypothetical protein
MSDSRLVQDPRLPLTIREHVVVPHALANAQLTDELGAYFDELGIGWGRHSTYDGSTRAWGAAYQCEQFPSTPAALFRLIGMETQDSTYGAFTGKRAKEGHHHTVRERRETLRWLADFAPKFTLVEAQAPRGRGHVLKAALAIPCALVPVAAPRQEDGRDPLARLWSEMCQAELPLPLLTTGIGSLTLDTMLEGSTRMAFDHFARVDPFYMPEAPSLRIEWTHPTNADPGLGFADNLHSCGTAINGSSAKIATLTVNKSTLYYAYGPTRSANFYLQRFLPEGRKATVEKLKQRILAVDPVAQLSLAAWPIERFRTAPKAPHGHARVIHSNVVAHGFPLFCDRATAMEPAPCDYTKLYGAWDQASPGNNEGAK